MILKYSRDHIRLYFLCYVFGLVLLSFGIFGYNDFDFSTMPFKRLFTFYVFILLAFLFVVNIYLMLKNPYLVIRGDVLIKRGPGQFAFMNREYHFDKITKSTRKDMPVFKMDHISFKTKFGLPVRLYLDNLCKVDQEKLLEVFRERGKLQD